MKLRNCAMKDFPQRLIGKKLVCFGAGLMPIAMCSEYDELQLDDKIAFLSDNDVRKWGNMYEYKGTHYPIVSPRNMAKQITSEHVLVITSEYYAEIIAQLDDYKELDKTECYIYPIMHSYFENHPIRYFEQSTGMEQIPKVIHYFWLGRGKIPSFEQKCIDSWKRCNPAWEIRQWNEDNYDVTKCAYMRQAYEHKKWGFVPDYARLDIIYEHGGIYLDTDVEVLKCLDGLLGNYAFCAFGDYSRIALGLGFGGVIGVPLFKEMRDMYEKERFVNKDGTLNLTTCTVYQMKLLLEKGLRQKNELQFVDGVKMYPSDFFSPVNSGTGFSQKQDNTYSIHHYKGSWLTNTETKGRQASRSALERIFARFGEP